MPSNFHASVKEKVAMARNSGIYKASLIIKDPALLFPEFCSFEDVRHHRSCGSGPSVALSGEDYSRGLAWTGGGAGG